MATNHTTAPRRCAEYPPRLLDTAEAAEVLRLGKRTVQELVAERKLAFVKIGRALRFHPEDLAAFIESNRRKPQGWKEGK